MQGLDVLPIFLEERNVEINALRLKSTVSVARQIQLYATLTHHVISEDLVIGHLNMANSDGGE